MGQSQTIVLSYSYHISSNPTMFPLSCSSHCPIVFLEAYFGRLPVTTEKKQEILKAHRVLLDILTNFDVAAAIYTGYLLQCESGSQCVKEHRITNCHIRRPKLFLLRSQHQPNLVALFQHARDVHSFPMLCFARQVSPLGRGNCYLEYPRI